MNNAYNTGTREFHDCIVYAGKQVGRESAKEYVRFVIGTYIVQLFIINNYLHYLLLILTPPGPIDRSDHSCSRSRLTNSIALLTQSVNLPRLK